MWTLEPGKVSWALNPALHLPYHVYLNFVDYLRTYNIKLGIKEGGLRNTAVLYLNLGISYITVCYFSSLYNTHKFFQRRQWHPTPVLLPRKSHGRRSLVRCSPRVARSLTRLSDFTFPFHFHASEKEMATHSSVLAWRIPGTGEPGGLPSLGSHRVGHNWHSLAAAAAASLLSLPPIPIPPF